MVLSAGRPRTLRDLAAGGAMTGRAALQHRALLVILGLLSLVAAGVLTQQLLRGVVLETDLQALFPPEADSRLTGHVNGRLSAEFGNSVLLGVRSSERARALAAAEKLEAAVAASGFMRVQGEAEMDSLTAQLDLLRHHHFHLLTESQRGFLQAGDDAALITRAQRSLFGFTGAPLSVLEDPLALLTDYVQALHPPVQGEVAGARLVFTNAGQTTVVVAAKLQADAFSLDLHRQLHRWLQETRPSLAAAEVSLLLSGAAFHAADASSTAQAEVALISFGSTAGLLLLFILAFRRAVPLLLSFASVAYGSLVAFAFIHFWYGQLHLMTLVFGASLIGVSVDYSLHYLCHHQGVYRAGAGSPLEALHGLLPALALGLLASLFGYACLLQTELPGLRQIAGFSLVGLTAAWLFVVALFPLFFRRPLPPPSPLIAAAAHGPWRFFAKLRTRPLLAALGLPLAALIWIALQVRPGYDLRLFYEPSPELRESEKFLGELLQGFSPHQYFLLQADSPEALLQKEEDFRQVLDAQVRSGALRDYAATSRLVPSLRRQQENYQQVANLYAPAGAAEQFMRKIGLDTAAISQLQERYLAAREHFLTPAEWLSVARPDQRFLWAGQVDGIHLSVIALRGVRDTAALAAAAEVFDGVRWVDRVAGLSHTLRQLQETAVLLLGLAYLAVLALMWLCYRRASAMLLVLLPALSTTAALVLLTLFQVPINLFHIFAGYLILGLGMDYSIFSHQTAADPSCQRAIFLSAVTSGLSFGLLALSSTLMVKAFGLALLLGCVFNFLLAPLPGRLLRQTES